MEGLRDPEGIEAKQLIRAFSWAALPAGKERSLGRLADAPGAGREVLEIGCGDGWLTWSYANQTKRVVGIDPDFQRLQKATSDHPPGITNYSLAQSMGENLPFSSCIFDIALFSNTL